jgi:hypothetical protein
MPQTKEISQPKQLLVEGRSAEIFFGALLNQLALNDVQTQNFGGNDELPGFLKALRQGPGFLEQVISVGIIRDAETDARAAFQSVCSALRGAGLAVPTQAMMPIGQRPQVGILILPDATTPGMLETLCLRSVADNPVIECIEQYFQCVEQCTSSLPNNMHKAKVQAFLASRSRPALLLGQAASAGYWPWDSPVFSDAKLFLQRL